MPLTAICSKQRKRWGGCVFLTTKHPTSKTAETVGWESQDTGKAGVTRRSSRFVSFRPSFSLALCFAPTTIPQLFPLNYSLDYYPLIAGTRLLALDYWLSIIGFRSPTPIDRLSIDPYLQCVQPTTKAGRQRKRWGRTMTSPIRTPNWTALASILPLRGPKPSAPRFENTGNRGVLFSHRTSSSHWHQLGDRRPTWQNSGNHGVGRWRLPRHGFHPKTHIPAFTTTTRSL